MSRIHPNPLNGMIYAKIHSGIETLDRIWGGFYKGRTYLVVGPHGSGKTILGLQFLLAGLKHGEKCTFVTEQRIEDLILQSESFGFDVKKHIEKEQLRFLRYQLSPTPDKTTIAINDIISYLETEEIQRLVLDTVIPLILPDLKEFRTQIEDMLYQLEALRVSTLMTIKEPANLEASRIVQALEELTTGVVRFSETPADQRIYFKVKWGYPTPVFSYDYKIVPSQGIVISEEKEESEEKEKESPQLIVKEKKAEFLPFNNFLNLIAQQIISPNAPSFSILALKFSSLSQRIIETVRLCLSETKPATLYQNSVLILLFDTRKEEAEIFSKEVTGRVNAILPSTEFKVTAVTFPEDGEDLDELLLKIA